MIQKLQSTKTEDWNTVASAYLNWSEVSEKWIPWTSLTHFFFGTWTFLSGPETGKITKVKYNIKKWNKRRSTSNPNLNVLIILGKRQIWFFTHVMGISLEMAHALNSTQIFHQLISVVSEEKDMEHFSIQDSREVILINSAFHTFSFRKWSQPYNATASSKLARENSRHFATPPLEFPWNDVWESKRAQKFHTDDATLPRSGTCF